MKVTNLIKSSFFIGLGLTAVTSTNSKNAKQPAPLNKNGLCLYFPSLSICQCLT